MYKEYEIATLNIKSHINHVRSNMCYHNKKIVPYAEYIIVFTILIIFTLFKEKFDK